MSKRKNSWRKIRYNFCYKLHGMSNRNKYEAKFFFSIIVELFDNKQFGTIFYFTRMWDVILLNFLQIFPKNSSYHRQFHKNSAEFLHPKSTIKERWNISICISLLLVIYLSSEREKRSTMKFYLIFLLIAIAFAVVTEAGIKEKPDIRLHARYLQT